MWERRVALWEVALGSGTRVRSSQPGHHPLRLHLPRFPAAAPASCRCSSCYHSTRRADAPTVLPVLYSPALLHL